MKLGRVLWLLTTVCLFGPQTVQFVETLLAPRLFVEAEEQDGFLHAGLWGECDALAIPRDRVVAWVQGEHEVWILERSDTEGFRLVRVIGRASSIHTETWPWQRTRSPPLRAEEDP